MLSVEEFTKICIVSASLLPRYAPDFKNPMIVSFWHKEFGKDPNFEDALKIAIKTLESFPTIAKMNELLGKKEISNEAKAKDSSDRIIGAIEKYGYNNWPRAKDYIGDIGWQVVENNGGWENMCEVTYDQIPIVKAQLRDSCKALLEKAKFGDIHKPPSLPESNNQKQIVSDALRIAGGG